MVKVGLSLLKKEKIFMSWVRIFFYNIDPNPDQHQNRAEPIKLSKLDGTY